MGSHKPIRNDKKSQLTSAFSVDNATIYAFRIGTWLIKLTLTNYNKKYIYYIQFKIRKNVYTENPLSPTV